MIDEVFESVPVPPSLSMTVTVTVNEPARRVRMRRAGKSRPASPTSVVSVVPSPQSIEHISVSSVPGSTIETSAVTLRADRMRTGLTA